MEKTIRLVATPEAIQKLGATPVENGKIPCADFEIDTSKCGVALGRWLAENIDSTIRDDPGARLMLVYPATRAGSWFANLGRAISGETHSQKEIVLPSFAGAYIRDRNALDRTVNDIRESLAKIEALIANDEAPFSVISGLFSWPVFGSFAGSWHVGVQKPEHFFDSCAQHLNAAIAWAGKDQTPLPEAFLKHQVKGRGLDLVAAYNQQAGLRQLRT